MSVDVAEVAEATMTGQLGTLAAEFVEQSIRLGEAESEVTSIKRRMAEIEPLLLEEMGSNGVSNMRVAGRTLYLRTDLFVNKVAEVASESIVTVLRTIGFAHLVTENYSPAGLKSQVKEWRESGEAIPAELAGMLKVSEVPRVICRK